MKRIGFLIGVMIFIVVTSFAQVDVGKGIKGGLNFATVGGSDAPSSIKSTTQYSVGGFLDIKFPMGVAIQPELLYSVKGYGETVVVSGYSYDGTQTLSYLDIPVLLKYNWVLSRRIID